MKINVQKSAPSKGRTEKPARSGLSLGCNKVKKEPVEIPELQTDTPTVETAETAVAVMELQEEQDTAATPEVKENEPEVYGEETTSSPVDPPDAAEEFTNFMEEFDAESEGDAPKKSRGLSLGKKREPKVKQAKKLKEKKPRQKEIPEEIEAETVEFNEELPEYREGFPFSLALVTILGVCACFAVGFFCSDVFKLLLTAIGG